MQTIDPARPGGIMPKPRRRSAQPRWQRRVRAPENIIGKWPFRTLEKGRAPKTTGKEKHVDRPSKHGGSTCWLATHAVWCARSHWQLRRQRTSVHIVQDGEDDQPPPPVTTKEAGHWSTPCKSNHSLRPRRADGTSRNASVMLLASQGGVKVPSAGSSSCASNSKPGVCTRSV